MAIKINTNLTTRSGISISSGALLANGLNFPKAESKNGTPFRVINYTIFVYANSQVYLDSESPIIEGVIEFVAEWNKIMTEAEYASVLANGALAEVWLKDHLETILGKGTCEVIDPFVKNKH